MNILSFFFRCIRFLIRKIRSLLSFIGLEYILIMNKVAHKRIVSKGLPHVDVHVDGICVLGDNLKINNGCYSNPIGFPFPSTIIVGPNAQLCVGDNVGMSQCAIVCHQNIVIEDFVKIGGGVKIYDTDFHSLDPFDRDKRITDTKGKKTSPIQIKKRAFIGAGSFILKGVVIGENSVIAAGSVVTKTVPDNEVWGGNPAKFIKTIK